jgi:hypothetical protein
MSGLEQTVSMMTSDDYKERFKAEYMQTKIRYERLKAFNNKIEAADRTACCEPTPYGVTNTIKKVEMPPHDCPSYLLREQQSVMGEYLHLLEVRAVIEGIEL